MDLSGARQRGYDAAVTRPWSILALGAIIIALAPAAESASAGPRPTYGYETPVQQTSPWPTMRRDRRNTGASPVVARYGGDRPWSFKTGKGIFSTPIVGGSGTIFVGSADTYFYAISPRGKQRWRYKTGNLIDSAGFIGPYDPKLRTNPIVVPSGDTFLYKIRSQRKLPKRTRRTIWRYTPHYHPQPPGQVPLVNWWEGNAEPAPDGTILAGSTGNAAYAIRPDGTLKWVYRSGGSFWTDPAIEPDGTTYWGSLDLQIHKLDSNGRQKWAIPTLGFVVSSPALASDGTLYIGSFDSNLYAIVAKTGRVKWAFPTADHVYSSPALDENPDGSVRSIYIASTDGQVYAVDRWGHLRWSYDTGDVIRSSPVVGLAPDGRSKIVYVGAGNGTVYAINAADGTRRWSYDTTRTDPILRDRNDLNASPALTKTGIVIGGEDGYVKYLPYDYCLHRRAPRCDVSAGGAFGGELAGFFPVTPGGNTRTGGGVEEVADSSVLATRMVVRRGGRTRDAAMGPLAEAKDVVSADPPFPFTAQFSGDGKYLYVVPEGLLTPGQEYTLRLRAPYSAQGLGVGNIRLPGLELGTAAGTLRFRVAPAGRALTFRTRPDKVTAFRLTRLAFPLPSFLPSVNQIGFDSYDLVVGTIAAAPPDASGQRRILLWALGARPGRSGVHEADPETPLAFPLEGVQRGDSLALSARNPTLTFSFGPVPAQRVVFRARMSRSYETKPGADIYAEVDCLSVPTYGPLLPTQRLCNNHGKIVANGTFVTGSYPSKGRVNRRPKGLSVTSISLKRPSLLSPGAVEARLALAPGASYPATRHLVSILLVDAATGAPVGMDYKARTSNGTAGGNINRVRLSLSRGTTLPAQLRAYVIADVFPLAERRFP
jgi:outer membrane protein assembly factor BamB